LKNIFWTEWFASPLIAHKNVHSIGITHEAMTQPLQLAVELVEQDIRGRLAAPLTAGGW